MFRGEIRRVWEDNFEVYGAKKAMLTCDNVNKRQRSLLLHHHLIVVTLQTAGGTRAEQRRHGTVNLTEQSKHQIDS